METLSSGVRVYPCATWEDFMKEVRAFHIGEFGSDRLFRGQADSSWKLASVWERTEQRYREKNPSSNIDISERKKYRDQYIKDFKEISIGMTNLHSIGLTENDWWALGRHHGLKTPLLDWTYRPYIAAYFAAFGYLEMIIEGLFAGTAEAITNASVRVDSDGKGTPKMVNLSIWGLFLTNEIKQLKELSIIEDRNDNAHRQKAQQGVFTRLEHNEYLDIEAYLASRELGHYLERYDIPLGEIEKIAKDLEDMNITPSVLFPDLVGAAMYANIKPMLKLSRLVKQSEEIFSKRQ